MSWKLQLLRHLYGIGKQLQTVQSCLLQQGEGQILQQRTIQEEFIGTKYSLAFCKQAEEAANQPLTNCFQDVSTGNNSWQVITISLKALISAKRVKSGDGSDHVLGQMSNETIQSIFLRPEPSSAYKTK